MKSIIGELWYGNIEPPAEYGKGSLKERQLLRAVDEQRNILLETLTDKQKKILEKFDDHYAELADNNEYELFIYAFRLGARFAIEVMS